jgi:hypothetical protein
MAITLDGTTGINTSGTLVATGSLTTSSSLTTGTGAVYDGISRSTAIASTSGTSIDFTSIPSWVKRITVMLSGVSTNGTNNYLLQIGSSSIATTGYTCRCLRDSTTALTATNGFLLTAGNNAAISTFGGSAVLTNISGNLWVFTSILADAGNGNNDYSGGHMTAALSGTLDRVRITTTTAVDLFDAGSINILYE